MLYIILKTMFYSLSIIPLIWEIYVYYFTEVVVETNLRVSHHKKNKTFTVDMIPASYILVDFAYILWNITGALFSTQSVLFIVLFILSTFPRKTVLAHKIDCIISIIIILFILVNVYVLKLPIYHLSWSTL